jgi:hypothetical protein
MPYRVVETPIASHYRKLLRGANLKSYENFLDDLAARGCESLDYRLTGEVIDRLCDKHLRGRWRAIVGFQGDTAWSVVLGEHLDGRANNVYQLVYRLADVDPPGQRRDKPACCDVEDDGNTADPQFDEELVSRFTQHTRRIIANLTTR